MTPRVCLLLGIPIVHMALVPRSQVHREVVALRGKWKKTHMKSCHSYTTLIFNPFLYIFLLIEKYILVYNVIWSYLPFFSLQTPPGFLPLCNFQHSISNSLYRNQGLVPRLLCIYVTFIAHVCLSCVSHNGKISPRFQPNCFKSQPLPQSMLPLPWALFCFLIFRPA